MPLGSSKNVVVLNGILKIFLKPLKWQSQNQERCLELKSLYVGFAAENSLSWAGWAVIRNMHCPASALYR